MKDNEYLEMIQNEQYWLEFITFYMKYCKNDYEDLSKHIVNMVKKATEKDIIEDTINKRRQDKNTPTLDINGLPEISKEQSKNQKLHELSKELVYQMTGKHVEDVQEGDFQIAFYTLNEAMDFCEKHKK